jgi:diacylglycerol kinase
MAFFLARMRSFKPAFEGWWLVLRSQQNTWVHTIISILAIGASLWLQISRVEWAIILLTMAMVWLTEFLNTSIEVVVDLVSPDPHPLAKAAKDISAAAVLIAALAALAIGLIIFLPPFLERI